MNAYCSSCRKPIADADILYTADARVVCAACSDVAEVQRDEGRAALNIHAAAWSCFAASIVAWFFNPFFVLNVSALLSGIYAIRSMSPANRQFTRYLTSGQRGAIWAAAVTGLAVTGLHLIFFAIILVGASAATSRY